MTGQHLDCGTSPSEQFTTVDFVENHLPHQMTNTEVLNEVPIQIHIIGANNGLFGIDTQIVLEELEIVNESFSFANIVFTMCNDINFINDNSLVTFIKNQSEYICDIHDVPNVINIYFTPNLEKENGEVICGYAYNFNIKTRAFVQNDCADNGSTFTHELGHSFSLLHTHSTSNGEELANGSNCSTAGDLLCDTPADPKLSNDNVNDNCEYIGTTLDNQQNPYNPSTDNLMSYSPKECRTQFTENQITQMEAFYLAEGAFLECGEPATSTNNSALFSAINIFPNPSNASLFIENIFDDSKLEIWNSNGQLITSFSNITNTFSLEIIEFKNFQKGIYYIKIVSSETFFTKKIIKI